MCRSSDSGKQPMIQWVQGLTVWKTQAITNGENMQMYAANACQHAYAIHIHTYYTHINIYIYTETAFLGIHMIKPLCKTVSKYIYIYINRSNIICKYDNYDFSSGVYVEIRQPSDRKLEPSALELLKSPSIPQWLSWLVLRILIPILSNPHFKSRWWFVIIHLDPPNTGKTK